MAAVDLGASSGRVIAGRLTDGRIVLTEASRFSNGPVEVRTEHGVRLQWDVSRLWTSVLQGLGIATRQVGALDSVGIDTWAVDYGLTDAGGELLANPSSYRCARTAGVAQSFFTSVPSREMYDRVGIQEQSFNTIFQLLSEAPEKLSQAHRMLLVPDLLSYWLTGRTATEVTNASTTGLLDPTTRSWQPDMLVSVTKHTGVDIRALLADLVEPGSVLGPVRASVGLTRSSGVPTSVVAVGSHDTASAVVGVPAARKDFAYISCGTWSLVGLELERAVKTEAARSANMTNELGVDNTVRFLKNVMGLWVFNEAVRTWREQGMDIDVERLVREAAACAPLRTVVDIDAPVFFTAGDMAARIADEARATGQPVPRTPGEVSRCIFDSLALAYRRSIHQAADAAGRDVSVIHMVGGGVQNALLCQLTANATGLPVYAGPVEATALGNLVVQARAMGALGGGLAEMRSVVCASGTVIEYRPVGTASTAWLAAERRIR